MNPSSQGSMKASPRIVFLGTPDFAVASLDALVKAGWFLAGVVTAPDKPAGRGMKFTESAVKKYALEKGLPLLQPEKLKNPEFLEQLRSLKADLQVVVAFRMLPEQVWNMPPLGTLNLHASLLPQYRGAAPINWAIINGEKETGITTFKLKQEIDTGNILLQEKISIGPEETAGKLHDRLKMAGAALLVKTIQGITEGTLKEIQQVNPGQNPSYELKTAPKLYPQTCRIDWNNTTEKIHNLVRGLSPTPGATTLLQNKVMKVFKVYPEKVPHRLPPGTWDTDLKTYLKCSCTDGFLFIQDLQLEGKKRLPVADFLRGYKFS